MLATPKPTSTLLIVDDDLRLHFTLSTLLADEAWQLVFAADGNTGLAQAKACLPDLILLDIILPDVDGLEVCRRLRADPLLGAVPILLLTSLTDPAMRLAGLEAGADDFISKPFDATDFRARVRSILRLNRYRQIYEERARGEAQRKQAEDQLRESERNYRTILQAVGDYLVVLDADGRIDYINHVSGGRTPEDFIGSRWFEWIAPADRPLAQAVIQRALSGQGAETIDYRVSVPHHREAWYQVKFTCLPGGPAPRVVLIARDITESKQAEQTLRQSEQRFALMFEKAPFAATLSKYPTGVMVDVNAAWVSLVGYSEAEMLGRTIVELNINADLDDRARLLAQLAERGAVRDHEMILRLKSGALCQVSLNIDLVEIGGQKYMLKMAQDITERRRVETLQQEMDVLQQMDRLRAALIGNVSHELRTPLGLILVMVTALRKERLGANPEVRDQFLRDVEEEARKLQGIVDSLLDESHLQSGRLVLDRRRLDARVLLRKTVELQAVKAPQHRFGLRVPEAELMATLDARRIEQVLRNLLDNAVKYSPPDTDITVWAEADEGLLRIGVSDEGAGIPHPERERIFERFYRLGDAHNPPVVGLGLGLSISRGIVEAHDGRLWVEGRSGGGSVFVFTLPMGTA